MSEPCLPEAQFRALYSDAEDLLYRYAGIDDLEGLAQLSERVANEFPDNAFCYIETMNRVLLGVDYTGPGTLITANQAESCAGLGRDPFHCPSNAIGWQDTGFDPRYRDGQDQLYHFWAYASEPFGDPYTGTRSALLANFWHEPGQSLLASLCSLVSSDLAIEIGGGTSWQDFFLAIAGNNFGVQLDTGAISPHEAADYLRTYLGPAPDTNSPNAISFLNRWIPLYGTTLARKVATARK